MNTDVAEPVHELHYAQVLNSNGNPNEAKTWLQAYLDKIPNDQAAINLLHSIEQPSLYYEDSTRFTIRKININSTEADFSPAFYQKGIVFASGRREAKNHKKSGEGSAFFDLYYSEADDLRPEMLQPPQQFDKKINSEYHEGPAVFYENGTKVIFTRNALVIHKGDSVHRLKLYYAQKDDKSNWSKPVALPFNSDDYSAGHPAISADETQLYFVSDMPGSLGGTDIYVSKWEEGSWGKPVNLGPQVNTSGNEMFPFLHENGTLYFASNGHGGLGGLDVYQANINFLSRGKVKNLGYPINTIKDDFGLIVNPALTSGYFSSNREWGTGSDNIYQFSIESQILTVKAFDVDTNEPVAGAEILFIGEGALENILKSNTDGTATAQLDPQQNYIVYAEKEGYYGYTVITSAEERAQGELLLEIPMRKENGLLDLTVRLLDFATEVPVTEALVSLTHQELKYNTEMITDAKGQVHLKVDNQSVYDISGKREGQPWTYLPINTSRLSDNEENQIDIYLLKEEDLNKTDVIVLNNGNQSDTLVASKQQLYALEIEKDRKYLVRKQDSIYVEPTYKINNPIEINNIYFEYNQAAIEEPAAAELHKIADLMQRNSFLQLTLGAHTDSRGSNAYNLKLSRRRAETTRDYLVSQGIAESRISFNYFGEEKILNNCGDTASCAEEAHSINRRVTFSFSEEMPASEILADNVLK